MKKKPELLAPAGTLDAFKTAILYGADAIYAGLPGFSMRARAKIDVDGVKQGIEFAHSKGKKVYLAFNLFAHDTDFQNIYLAQKFLVGKLTFAEKYAANGAKLTEFLNIQKRQLDEYKDFSENGTELLGGWWEKFLPVTE